MLRTRFRRPREGQRRSHPPRKTHPQFALCYANLQVLCSSCNRGKGNRDRTDWRYRPAPAAPTCPRLPGPVTTKLCDLATFVKPMTCATKTCIHAFGAWLRRVPSRGTLARHHRLEDISPAHGNCMRPWHHAAL